MDFLTLTLNPCVDRTLWCDAFGGPVAAIDHQSGGKGVNIARVLTALGARALAIAPCGGGAGDRFCALARAEGIDLLPIPIAGETRTIDTLVQRGDYAQRVTRGAAPDMSEAECAAVRDAVAARLPDVRCLVIGGSACCERAAHLAPQLIAMAKAAGVRTFLDSNGDALRYGAEALPDVIKPNQLELAQLLDQPVSPGEEEGAAQALIARGVTAVLVSLGESGSMYAIEGQSLYCPPVKVHAVNPVGSGDSFSAGWLYAQLMGYSDQMALALANCAGAANAAMFPAARITKHDVEKLLGYTI